MRLTTRLRLYIRARRIPRGTCACTIELIQLLGEHAPYCPNHTTDRPFTVDPKPAHQIDGVPMPWAGNRWSDLNHRWCDLSDAGDFTTIRRRWPTEHALALVWPYHDRWMWQLLIVSDDGDYQQQILDQEAVAQGAEDHVVDALDAAEKAVANMSTTNPDG